MRFHIRYNNITIGNVRVCDDLQLFGAYLDNLLSWFTNKYSPSENKNKSLYLTLSYITKLNKKIKYGRYY